MKTIIKKILGVGALGLALAGCSEYTKNEQSEILYEKGKVITTLYNKEHTSTDIAPGMTSGGDIAISVNSTTFPETWGVVFRCEHGNKFPIIGKENKYKKLWEKFDDGDSVNIAYKENYKVKYERKTDKVIAKELTDYDFIDAEKILFREQRTREINGDEE